jgi:hypothetical protein
MMKKAPLIAAILVSICAQVHPANNTVTGVDWKKGVVTAFGESEIHFDGQGTPIDPEIMEKSTLNRARLDSYRKAREKALQGLSKSLKTIRVDAEKTLRVLIKDEVDTQERLFDIIEKKARVYEYPLDFHRSGCRAELKIGDIISAIPYRYPSNEFPSMDDNPIPTRYTGLIIDARGLGIKPMIFPSVYNENGLEIYGRQYIDVRTAAYRGTVAYVSDEKEAMKNKKAGDRPFYTAAIRELNGCPVISYKAMKRMYSHRDNLESLKKCNVVIIVDRDRILKSVHR